VEIYPLRDLNALALLRPNKVLVTRGALDLLKVSAQKRSEERAAALADA